MFKVECSGHCGNSDQYAGFINTENGLICKVCAQPALLTENDELERKYPQWYLDAEFILKS